MTSRIPEIELLVANCVSTVLSQHSHDLIEKFGIQCCCRHLREDPPWRESFENISVVAVPPYMNEEEKFEKRDKNGESKRSESVSEKVTIGKTW